MVWEAAPERGVRGDRGRPLRRDDGGESVELEMPDDVLHVVWVTMNAMLMR